MAMNGQFINVALVTEQEWLLLRALLREASNKLTALRIELLLAGWAGAAAKSLDLDKRIDAALSATGEDLATLDVRGALESYLRPFAHVRAPAGFTDPGALMAWHRNEIDYLIGRLERLGWVATDERPPNMTAGDFLGMIEMLTKRLEVVEEELKTVIRAA